MCIGLLAFTYMYGVVRGGARRWIPLGFFGQLQPSELTKIACVARRRGTGRRVAARATRDQRVPQEARLLRRHSAVLIVFQPDLGTTILMVVGVGIVLFLGGIELRWVGMAGALVVAFGVFMVAIAPYRLERVSLR